MEETPTPERFVALDVHKHYVVAAAVDGRQQLVLRPRRLSMDGLASWTMENLRPTDSVVFEATTNAWEVHDLLKPLVASVKVAHPLKVTMIAKARVKTDARDAVALARLLAVGLIPEVWVPPEDVRQLRLLVGHRQRLIRQRTQARNRLRSVLHRRNLAAPEGNAFSEAARGWWLSLGLPPLEALRVRQDLAILDGLAPLIDEVEDELLRLSVGGTWGGQVPFVVQLPGMGAINAMILLSAIGDVARFPSAKHLVGYSGLGTEVHSSGQTYRTGRITKQGRREMRTALVEAAWVAVRDHPRWKERFARLSARVGKPKAIVAIARKLLVALWHVLTKREADRDASPVAVARKLMRWGVHRGVARSQGLSRAAFVKKHLVALGMAEGLERFPYGSKMVLLHPKVGERRLTSVGAVSPGGP